MQKIKMILILLNISSTNTVVTPCHVDLGPKKMSSKSWILKKKLKNILRICLQKLEVSLKVPYRANLSPLFWN